MTWLYDLLTWMLGYHIGTIYSPPASAVHSPDTTSPIYPDRPIRPLPKRRIRSRLSPNVADSILYPSGPVIPKPVFYIPYNAENYGNGARSNGGLENRGLASTGHLCNHDNDHNSNNQCDTVESEDEVDGTGLACYQKLRSVAAAANHVTNGYRDGNHRQDGLASSVGLNRPPAPPSTSSSADGYDSFENTNNKKKRKIPTSGNTGHHHSSLSADMANMGISTPHEPNPASPDECVGGVGQYYGSGSSATPTGVAGSSISGAGRGRYGRNTGRSASGRSPLGVSTNASNAWMSGRSSAARRDWTLTGSPGNKGEANSFRTQLCFVLELILISHSSTTP